MALGLVLRCRALAVLEVDQKAEQGGRQRNDRIIAVVDGAAARGRRAARAVIDK